jgi:hypothetical protein
MSEITPDLSPGSAVKLDGVIESRHPADEEFGRERLRGLTSAFRKFTRGAGPT